MTLERLADVRVTAALARARVGSYRRGSLVAEDLHVLATEVDRLRAKVEAVDRLCRARDDGALIWVRDVAEALADRG